VENEFVVIALKTREELRAVYAQTYASEDAKRAAKAATFDQLRERLLAMDRRYGGSLRMAKWLEKPVNNARLNTIATYHELVPAFEALLAKHQGDLEAFFDDVKKMRPLSKEERVRQLTGSP
jgi:predicted aminopeptidase